MSVLPDGGWSLTKRKKSAVVKSGRDLPPSPVIVRLLKVCLPLGVQESAIAEVCKSLILEGVT